MTGPSTLRRRILEEIDASGPMPLERYMQLCLTDAEGGVYRRGAPIGSGGDFVTAPEISQAFGELLGLWCAAVAAAMPPETAAAEMRLVEIGPGRGTLMADALRALRLVPALRSRLTVHLVEVSEVLTAEQRRTLADTGVPIAWHRDVAEVPPGPTLLIANELIDALPVRQLGRGPDGSWRERCVGRAGEGGLSFVAGRAIVLPEGLPALVDAAPPGSILELRPAVDSLMRQLAGRAAKAPLAAIVIDYGHLATGLGDTLQAVSRHVYVDPLADPGGADLSAQVDFAALAATARTAGLAVDGPILQAELLSRLGLTERTERLMRNAAPRAAQLLESGAARLLSPDGMGGLFKAIGLRSPGLPVLPAF